VKNSITDISSIISLSTLLPLFLKQLGGTFLAFESLILSRKILTISSASKVIIFSYLFSNFI